MKTKENGAQAQAMAFFHGDGLPSAWKQAIKFAGPGGRIGTMLDVIASRTATVPGEAPWENYYTTLTGEYFGSTKQGTKIIIVAHGIGPMATLDGIQKAYS